MAEGFWLSEFSLLMSNEEVEQRWQGFKYSFSPETLKVMSDVVQQSLLLRVDVNGCIKALWLKLLYSIWSFLSLSPYRK